MNCKNDNSFFILFPTRRPDSGWRCRPPKYRRKGIRTASRQHAVFYAHFRAPIYAPNSM